MTGKVKFTDIARQSGVSVPTVSLVLNNKPGVSEETRERVLEVAGQLGYPLKSAASQRNRKSLTTIGMVVKIDPDIPPQANPFYSKVILGIEDACRRNGINLLFATLPVDENNRPLEVPQILNNGFVDGLLLVGTFVDETFSLVTNRYPTPIVLVDGYSKTESFDSVVSDNFRAAYQAVKYLIDKGHRHIGLVGSDDNCFPSLRERRNGYLRALKENEITEVSIANFNINKSHGYQETISLLQEHPQITALFCVNDEVGSTTIRAAQSQGECVPEDISIVGYDDTYFAANTHPALTTMQVDTVAMGRAAVHLLSLRLENPASARITLTIHPTLVERESVGIVRSNSRTREAAHS
jgi:LacI family transcriptional regulator